MFKDILEYVSNNIFNFIRSFLKHDNGSS